MTRLGLVAVITGSAICGACAVIALALWGPLTPRAEQTAPIVESANDIGSVERFIITAPDDIIAVTHNGDNMLNPAPTDIARFTEASLQPGLLLAAKVRNSAGEVIGFAVETETIDSSSNLLVGRLRMNTDWTMVLPGRGTLFLTQIEDSGSTGRDIIPAVMIGGAWDGDVRFISTAGPHASGRGIIVGGTGEFAAAEGTFVESTRLRHMSRERGGVGVFELQVRYEAPTAELRGE